MLRWPGTSSCLGRSLKDLVAFLSELHALDIDLFLHQQGLDTTRQQARPCFRCWALERWVIQEWVRAGLQRAKREGKWLGRPHEPRSSWLNESGRPWRGP
jgi:DNA invertase Pin-like site-specific DNA recombinase